MSEDKAALRRILRERRQGISPTENAAFSAHITERILALPAYIAAKRVFCYSSLRNEVGTHSLIREALHAGKEVYLPVVRDAVYMDAVRLYTQNDAMKKGKLGVWEPVRGEIAEPRQLDIALVPGVGFDKKGNRIGYGAGYYDRYLRLTQCITVGMAFEAQMVNHIPTQAHDTKMRYVVTECRVYDCVSMED